MSIIAASGPVFLIRARCKTTIENCGEVVKVPSGTINEGQIVSRGNSGEVLVELGPKKRYWFKPDDHQWFSENPPPP